LSFSAATARPGVTPIIDKARNAAITMGNFMASPAADSENVRPYLLGGSRQSVA
jgi:hypothetical protein